MKTVLTQVQASKAIRMLLLKMGGGGGGGEGGTSLLKQGYTISDNGVIEMG